MYNSNSQTTPSIALPNFQKYIKKHSSVQSINDKQYLILYRGTNNGNELENVSSKNAVFRQGSSLTDPKLITEKDISSAVQHIANNENARGGTRGIDSPFCSYTTNKSVAQSFGQGTILTIMIPLEDIEIYDYDFKTNKKILIYDTKEHDPTKIPLVIGSYGEDEILVPHGTPIAGWGIYATKEKSQPLKLLQTKDEVDSHIKDLKKEFQTKDEVDSRIKRPTHFRKMVSQSETSIVR